jgi:hypothetical protein
MGLRRYPVVNDTRLLRSDTPLAQPGGQFGVESRAPFLCSSVTTRLAAGS